jgi:hypothetical protein
LVQNCLEHRDRIDWGTWGGRYNRCIPPADWANDFDTSHFGSALDNVIGVDGTLYATPQASVWRWRSAQQNDFAARMLWTFQPNFSDAGRPPVLNVNGRQGPSPFVASQSDHT